MDKINPLTQIFIERLEKKGMDPRIIPGFIRNLANTVLAHSTTSLVQVNDKLHSLGWDDFDMDYRTFELATACFESNGLKGVEDYTTH